MHVAMTTYDFLIAPVYFLLVLLLAYKITAKQRRTNHLYRYFMAGLLVRMFGAIALGFIYYYHYKGGDTINYHETACTLIDVLYERPDDFMYLYFGKPMVSEYYLLQSEYSFSYWVQDTYAYFASKIFVPIEIVCFQSYLASTIVTAAICYIGIWQLYLVFCREFPALHKQFAWSILFVPSLVFWGSGIMKDSVTLSATGLYVHGFYWFFTRKQRKIKHILVLAAGVYLLLMIKPYILFVLLPGSALWFVSLRVAAIRNTFLRLMVTPTLLAVGLVIGFFILRQMGDALGKYSVDTVLKTASVAQRDLKQGYYEGNSFDIGEYEPTVAGALSVSHKAIFAALFRPTLLDVRNVVMLIAALENTFILGFCLYLLVKLKFFRFFDLVTTHPLVLFSVLFAVFFAFSVGISISNFGALVRLKIPSMPFFISALVILNYQLQRGTRPDEIAASLQQAAATTPSA